MTLLTTKYKKSFSAEIRQQGEKLIEQQATTSYRADPQSIQGEIRDHQRLLFLKTWLFKKEIFWHCDCQCGKHPQVCAHLWAFFLLADRNEDFTDGGKRGVSLHLASSETSSRSLTTSEETEEDNDKQLSSPPQFSFTDKTLLLVLQDLNSKREDLPAQLFWSGKTKDQKWMPPKPLDFQQVIPQDFSENLSHFLFPLLRPCYQTPSKDCSLTNYFLLKEKISHVLIPYLSQHKRLFLKGYKKALPFLGDDYLLTIDFQRISNGFYITLFLQNQDKDSVINFQDLLWLGETGLFITQQGVGKANLYEAFPLIASFVGLQNSLQSISSTELFVQRLLGRSSFPKQDLPSDLIFPEAEIHPIGHLFFRPAKFKFNGAEWLHAELSFEYAGLKIPEENSAKQLIDRQHRTVIPRQWQEEYRLREQLLSLHFRYAEKAINEEIGWKLAPKHLDEVVKTLLPQQWQIIAEGKSYRLPTEKKIQITTHSNDWFEIQGGINFAGEFIPLPQLLEMIKKQQNIIILGDGSFGVLPVEWLMNYTILSEFTITEGDLLKFKKKQIHLLNSLLEKLSIDFDEEANLARKRIQQDFHYHAISEPQGFNGHLRSYQQVGLGWLVFLQKYGFGGCLADDMGLGKTVQVLALLQKFYFEQSEVNLAPSLLVLPRSLIFNWQLETEKFAPNLKVHLHLGNGRMQRLAEAQQAHLILTTYGTLRRDAGALRHFHFSYCILDEAQAIKNGDSATSKAAQLIKADYRLAISGTPIENRLNDLLSLFQFLNPGLLHYSSLMQQLSQQNEITEVEAEQIRHLISPLILRRTKQQAAPELPPKTEDILWCDMEPAQRHHYEQLKSYYKQLFSEENEMASTPKIESLAALLRLRQVACHPGLLNDKYRLTPSGKVTVLLEKIQELIAEGHKILIFSQFVKLLGIVKHHLEEQHLNYCYLDGQTENRQDVVNDFQNSPDKAIFLISLKAGGVGLNLTSADYVFLLDPWWNPAIESQAIDRAFRIGQTRQVLPIA